MAVYCFTQLIQPGKREEAKAVFDEIRETRQSEYEASRRRLGIREERVWFQTLPQGDMAVVYWEGDDSRGVARVRLLDRSLRRVAHRARPGGLPPIEEVFDAKVG